jgi:hypothetical protein
LKALEVIELRLNFTCLDKTLMEERGGGQAVKKQPGGLF